MTLGKEHMSLHVKEQGELMSYKNQSKELNQEERHSRQQGEMAKKYVPVVTVLKHT